MPIRHLWQANVRLRALTRIVRRLSSLLSQEWPRSSHAGDAPRHQTPYVSIHWAVVTCYTWATLECCRKLLRLPVRQFSWSGGEISYLSIPEHPCSFDRSGRLLSGSCALPASLCWSDALQLQLSPNRLNFPSSRSCGLVVTILA